MPLTPTEARLADLFLRNGCARSPDPHRRKADGRRYKKGYEIRMHLATKSELTETLRLLRRAGLASGTPYPKRNQWVVPIYGRDPYARITAWAEERRRAGA